jgi:hypothetical protein
VLVSIGGDAPKLAYAILADVENPPASASLRPIADLPPGDLVFATGLGSPGQGSPVILASLRWTENEYHLLDLLQVAPGGDIVRRTSTVVGVGARGPIAVRTEHTGHVKVVFIEGPVSSYNGPHLPPTRRGVDHAQLVELDVPLASLLPASVRRYTRLPVAEYPSYLVVYERRAEPGTPPAVFVRAQNGDHVFVAPGSPPRPIKVSLQSYDEIALAKGDCWYLVINDGVSLRSENLSCRR